MTQRNLTTTLLLAIALVTLLQLCTACGGGGEDDDELKACTANFVGPYLGTHPPPCLIDSKS